MEANRPGVMSTQRKRIRRSQGCMAAQVIFHHRCEPTQVKIAVSTGGHKGCLAVTVLRCDFLHDIIGRKCGNEAYTRRIAREQFVREGIDVVILNWHVTKVSRGKNRLLGGGWSATLTLGLLQSCPSDRHRGGGHPPTPATPPCVRIRTRRFDWLR